MDRVCFIKCAGAFVFADQSLTTGGNWKQIYWDERGWSSLPVGRAGAGREYTEVVSVDVTRQSWRSFILMVCMIASWLLVPLLSFILHTSHSSNFYILTASTRVQSADPQKLTLDRQRAFFTGSPASGEVKTEISASRQLQQTEILVGNDRRCPRPGKADGSLVFFCPR